MSGIESQVEASLPNFHWLGRIAARYLDETVRRESNARTLERTIRNAITNTIVVVVQPVIVFDRTRGVGSIVGRLPTNTNVILEMVGTRIRS